MEDSESEDFFERERERFRSGLKASPVEVFCRIKPCSEELDNQCIQILSKEEIKLSTPESRVDSIPTRSDIIAGYSTVFQPEDSQEEIFLDVAYPLLQRLVSGFNSLLFTYGVTGSGKTHTLTGSPEKIGIIPRTLKHLFNAIKGFQLARNILFVENDGSVVFGTSSEASYVAGNQFGPLPENYKPWLHRSHIGKLLFKIDYDKHYAVLISYVELYGGKTYDLLSPGSYHDKSVILKDITATKSMFNGCEYQVQEYEEALSAFLLGRKRRHQHSTQLNTTSSRGHAIFTIRLVNLPSSSEPYSPKDSECAIVSQFSICDLAGSERARRTKNESERLKEAATINQSISALNKCIRALHANQKIKMGLQSGPMKIVPYRDNQITLIFKTFFEGNGKIRMIICMSPHGDEFEENIHVLNFSETSREIVVKRQVVSNQVKTKVQKNDATHVVTEKNITLNETDFDQNFDLPPCPHYILSNPQADDVITEFRKYVHDNVVHSTPLVHKLKDIFSQLREQVKSDTYDRVYTEEMISTKAAEIKHLKSELHLSKAKAASMEDKITKNEDELSTLRNLVERYRKDYETANNECKSYKETMQKMEGSLREKFEKKFKEEKAAYQTRLLDSKLKMRQVLEIAQGDPSASETDSNFSAKRRH